MTFNVPLRRVSIHIPAAAHLDTCTNKSTLLDFPWERFLKKVTSPASAAVALLKFAYSRRLFRRYLDGNTELVVRTLPNKPRDIIVPEPSEWREIGLKCLVDHGYKDNILNDIPEETGLATFSRNNTMPGRASRPSSIVNA